MREKENPNGPFPYSSVSSRAFQYSGITERLGRGKGHAALSETNTHKM